MKYKDSSIFNKVESGIDYNTNDPRLLLEYFLNGYFINKNEISQEFKDLLSFCLHIDPDKRKNVSFLLNHPLFDEVRNQLNFKDKYYLKFVHCCHFGI